MYEHGRLATGGLTFSELQQRATSMPGRRRLHGGRFLASASGEE